jgi:threonine/homoserine/homoserine lactone efflux protein
MYDLLAMARALGLGLGLGAVTGMPIGVINVAIVDAVAGGRRRFAAGLGLGGGAADAIHAALAFAGVGRIVTASPALVRSLAIAAAVAITGYVAVRWTAGRRADRADQGASAPRARSGDRDTVLAGLATGFLLTLPNPAALGAWVAVAASVWPDAALPEAAALGAGVGSGSALWFACLARWLGRVRRDHPALAVIPRVALLVLIAIAAIGVVRAMTAAPA